MATITTISRFIPQDRDEFAALEFERSIALIESGRIDRGREVMSAVLEMSNLTLETLEAGDVRSFDEIAVTIIRRVQRMEIGSEIHSVFSDILENRNKLRD